MSNIGEYITVKEYAEMHGVSESAVRQRIFRGRLPYKKIGEGQRSINLIKSSEPWGKNKPGAKPGSSRKS